MDKAFSLIEDVIAKLDQEVLIDEVHIEDANHRVLAEDIHAAKAIPPFRASVMVR